MRTGWRKAISEIGIMALQHAERNRDTGTQIELHGYMNKTEVTRIARVPSRVPVPWPPRPLASTRLPPASRVARRTRQHAYCSGHEA